MLDRRGILRSLLSASTLLLASCGGGGSEDAGTGGGALAARPVEQSDLQIANALFSGATRTPANFYVETPPSGHELVATTHLKNTDIDRSVGATQAQFELCTNDWNQALTWSEASAQAAPDYAQLVATNADERFFEFGRVRNGEPEIYVQSRIYKCAYLDRTSSNLRTALGAAGTLNARPITQDELERISEYLWQFTSYNNYGNLVLDSVRSTQASLAHTLHIAKLVRGGLSPTCERIDVIAWTHSVDMSTGALTLNVQLLWSFGARELNGAVELCTS